MGAPGVHRSFFRSGTPRIRQSRRPHSWSSKDLHAGEEVSRGIKCEQSRES